MPTNKPEVVLPELPEPIGNKIVMTGDDYQNDYVFFTAAYNTDQLLASGQACIDTLTRTADGEYDRELIACMLQDFRRGRMDTYKTETVEEQIALLRAADNRDATGVHTANLSAAPQQGGQEVEYACSECVYRGGLNARGACPLCGLKPKPQQPAEAVAEELWCLHLQGPDDVYAAPSKAEAERVAKNINDQSASHEVKPNAVAALWPHSPESHSESLKDWQAEWGVASPAASIWIQFSADGSNIRFWTRDQNRAVEESFCHARPLTAYYLTPPPAIDIGKLLAEARRNYRDSDAAGDVLDWLEEQAALIGDGGEKGNG